jgi:AraC-like DNA-binding protein
MVMRRLQQAKALMGEGEGFADVAAATGFADQAHFIRHFKKAYGVTPGRWAGLQRFYAAKASDGSLPRS